MTGQHFFLSPDIFIIPGTGSWLKFIFFYLVMEPLMYIRENIQHGFKNPPK